MTKYQFMRNYVIPIIFAVLLCACGGTGNGNKQVDSFLSEESVIENPHMPSDEARKYNDTKNRLADIDVQLRSYMTNKNEKRFKSLLKTYEKLQYEYDDSGMDDEGRRECMLLQARTDSVRTAVESLLKNEFAAMKFPCFSESDYLIHSAQRWPVYMQKGTKLFYTMSTNGNVTMKIYNADAHNTLKTSVGKRQVRDSLSIQNSAIYLIEITPKGSAYIDLNVEKKLSEFDQMGERHYVQTDTVDCAANDFMAVKVPGIDMKNIFEEPRKFTLRSVGKSFFSGTSRAVVTLNVPKGCTDILYSLRISTNEGDRNTDGKFNKRMMETYKKVKFLGLPLYESTKTVSATSLLRELLYRNQPVREEEAYCNVYVFTNQAEAKKFQDGAAPDGLKYNIDLSLMGTQSCNGRIPTKGLTKVYLGFANERFRYSNYLWLEAVSVTPKNEYYKVKYRVK